MADDSILGPDASAFVAAARRATLSTIGPAGRPRSVPICFVLGPGGLGTGTPPIHSPLDEKPKATADPRDLGRVRDLLARPEATLLVDRWSENWARLAWVRLDVRGALVEPGAPDHGAAVGALRAKYPQYGRHRLEARPLLRFTIERVVTWGDLTPGDQASAADRGG